MGRIVHKVEKEVISIVGMEEKLLLGTQSLMNEIDYHMPELKEKIQAQPTLQPTSLIEKLRQKFIPSSPASAVKNPKL